MKINFTKPTLNDEQINLLNQIGKVTVKSKIDESADPPGVIPYYELELDDNFAIKLEATKSFSKTPYIQYYFKGYMILNLEANAMYCTISSANIKQALGLNTDDQEVKHDLDEYNDYLKNYEYDEELNNSLLQLNAIVNRGGAERGYGSWAEPHLQILSKLRQQNPDRHDKLIKAHPYAGMLLQQFPNWGASSQQIKDLESKDRGVLAALYTDSTREDVPTKTYQETISYQPNRFKVAESKIEYDKENDSSPVTNADIQNKIELIRDLKAYITRINPDYLQSHQPDFQKGFHFFKESQAGNRQANYHLAIKLLNKLEYEVDVPIREIFKDVQGERNQIFESLQLKTPNRGINSSQLNAIIRKAEKLDPAVINVDDRGLEIG